MLADQIRNEYFDWMIDLVNANRGPKEISYIKLLEYDIYFLALYVLLL